MNKKWLSLTWWIPLPDPIDLPDGHRRNITSMVHPTHAIPDGQPLAETGSLFQKIDHEVRLTVHQRELDVPISSLVQGEVFRTSIEYDPDSSMETESGKGTRPGYVSVVEAEARVYEITEVDNETQSVLFDMVLGRVRQLQEAMALLTENLNKELVTRERLPAMLPMLVLSSDVGEDQAEGPSIFLVNEFALADVTPPEPISASRFGDLTDYLERDERDEGFSAYHRLRYATSILCYRQGDYRMTIISAAIAAESLLDEMLMALLWEEGNYPETVAAKFDPDSSSLLKRVKSEYARHLGGQWNPNKKGAIRDWREKIAEPRNVIAHSGAMATSGQAREALKALRNLEEFLGQRLRNKVGERPRVATLFVSARVLAAEKLVSKRINKLYEDPTEPVWLTTFRRWRDVLELELAIIQGTRIEPDRDRSVVVAMIGAAGPEFALLDEAMSIAARISPVPDMFHDQYKRWIAGMEEDGVEPWEGAVCRLILDDSNAKHQLQLDGDWKYAYKLVPTFSVMANRRDRG